MNKPAQFDQSDRSSPARPSSPASALYCVEFYLTGQVDN